MQTCMCRTISQFGLRSSCICYATKHYQHAIFKPHHPYASSIFPRSDTYKPSKNYHGNNVRYTRTRCQSSAGPTFRISLFLTLHICWISAALCDTFSKEFPVSWSSSFTFFDGSISTPGSKVTLRTIFSPMKFLRVHSQSNTARAPNASISIMGTEHTGFPPHIDRSRGSSQY